MVLYISSKEASLYLKNDGVDIDYNLQPSDTLFKFAKNEIYPYILKSSKGLKDEFLKRVNHYKTINEDDSFIGLQAKLYKYINELYSLVDLDAALSLEDTDMKYIEAYCITALESLNTNTSSDESNYYSQIKEQVQDQSNFYSLDFSKTVDEICEEVGFLRIYSDENLLNIRKIIAQYENLEQPIKIDIINKFPQLVDDVDEFQKIHTDYLAGKNKLKGLLMRDFEEKGLYYFYLFGKLVNCDESLQETEPFRYFHLYISILFVLIYLRNFLEEENGYSISKIKNDFKKATTIFEPYFGGRNQNELHSNLFDIIELDDLELDLIKSAAEGLSNPQIAEKIYHKREKEQQIKNKFIIIYEKLASKYPDFEGKEKNKRRKLTELYKKAIEEKLI